MYCPKCHNKMSVIDSRPRKFQVIRKRLCKKCGLCFWTYEKIPGEVIEMIRKAVKNNDKKL